MALFWLLLLMWSGAQQGMILFIFSYVFIKLTSRFGSNGWHSVPHLISLSALVYFVFFHASAQTEELHRTAVFVMAYLVGAVAAYIILYVLVWKDLNGENCGNTQNTEIKPRDILLTLISIYLAYRFLTSLPDLPRLFSANVELFRKSMYFISIIVTGIAAVGIWLNKKWGALSYIGMVIIMQSYSMISGNWSPYAGLVSILIGVLLWPKIQFMRKTSIKAAQSDARNARGWL